MIPLRSRTHQTYECGMAGPAAAPPRPQRSLLEGQAGTDYVGGSSADYTVDGSAPALTRC